MDDKLLEFLQAENVPTFSMSSGLTLDDFGWGSPTFHKMVRLYCRCTATVLPPLLLPGCCCCCRCRTAAGAAAAQLSHCCCHCTTVALYQLPPGWSAHLLWTGPAPSTHHPTMHHASHLSEVAYNAIR
jgi:hypothetical protein